MAMPIARTGWLTAPIMSSTPASDRPHPACFPPTPSYLQAEGKMGITTPETTSELRNHGK